MIRHKCMCTDTHTYIHVHTLTPGGAVITSVGEGVAMGDEVEEVAALMVEEDVGVLGVPCRDDVDGT